MLKLDEPLLARSGQSEEESASEYDREHLDYLERMASEGVVPRALAQKAAAVWVAARDAVDGRLRVPAASTDDDGPFQYYWPAGDHTLSIEISADEPAHWVYYNTATKELWGTEIAVEDVLPERLVEYIRRIAESAD